MPVAALTVELRLPLVHSLKEKRAVLKPIIEGAHHRHHVAAAELDHQDSWQRATIGFAAVASTHSQVDKVLAAVERFVWSFPEVEILDVDRTWLEMEPTR